MSAKRDGLYSHRIDGTLLVVAGETRIGVREDETGAIELMSGEYEPESDLSMGDLRILTIPAEARANFLRALNRVAGERA